MNNVPIALFTYKRPNHLLETLHGLQINQVTMIYVFSDGARAPEDEPDIDRVRKNINSIDWAEIYVVEREENWGLGKSIRAGVSEVLQKHDQVIVVEDDIVLRPGAYQYAVEALDRYKDNPKVMSITMWSDPSLVPFAAKNGFFSKRFVCWGWGTYAHQWQKFTKSPLELYSECERRGLNVLKWGKDLKHQAEVAEERNLWYVGFALTHFLEDGISYLPSETLTVNIGFDGTGENCGLVQINEQIIDKPVNIPIKWPKPRIRWGVANGFAEYFGRRKKVSKRLRSFLIRHLRKVKILRKMWHTIRSRQD